MARAKTPDQDSPWKEALDHFLEAFLLFFFPDIHADIDGSRSYELLDKEFHQIVRHAEVGKRLADKLFKVWLNDGQESWLLVHLEVQGHAEEDFPERMFVYNYRIFDRYNRTVVGLSVLTDDRPDWRPTRFEYGRWGCRTGTEFRAVKVLDYAERRETLETSPNPFAAVVLAQLEARQWRLDPQARQREKVRLVKGLYGRGWSAEDVRKLFRLIDWLVELPDELQERFLEEIEEFEQEQRMPYLSSIERLAMKEGLQKGRQQGRQQGLLEAIAIALEGKFGVAGRRLMAKVRALKDMKRLRAFFRGVQAVTTLDEARRLLG